MADSYMQLIRQSDADVKGKKIGNFEAWNINKQELQLINKNMR